MSDEFSFAKSLSDFIAAGIAAVIGGIAWTVRKLIGMDNRVAQLEREVQERGEWRRGFIAEYKHDKEKTAQDISDIKADIARMSAGIDYTSQATAQILDEIRRR